MPALPLHEAGKYVAGAYIVLFALVLAYVAIMALRLSRTERELGELLELTERENGAPPTARGPDSAQPSAASPDGAGEPALAREESSVT